MILSRSVVRTWGGMSRWRRPEAGADWSPDHRRKPGTCWSRAGNSGHGGCGWEGVDGAEKGVSG